jgi:hypothetical protein
MASLYFLSEKTVTAASTASITISTDKNTMYIVFPPVSRFADYRHILIIQNTTVAPAHNLNLLPTYCRLLITTKPAYPEPGCPPVLLPV